MKPDSLVGHVNDTELNEIIQKGGGWNAIAFLSYGSYPCDHFRPEFEALAKKYRTKMFCGWLDVVENPTITATLGVLAVPTMVVWKSGHEMARYEGPYSHESLIERLQAVMAPKKRKTE